MKKKDQLQEITDLQIQLQRNDSQVDMLNHLQGYFSSTCRSRHSQVLAGQALAYVEALKLWQRERNELFIPKFMAYEERKGIIQKIKEWMFGND